MRGDLPFIVYITVAVETCVHASLSIHAYTKNNLCFESAFAFIHRSDFVKYAQQERDGDFYFPCNHSAF